MHAELEIAERFARAYRGIDEEVMRAVLAPTARIRLLLPKRSVELQGPDALIATLREFASKWRTDDADPIAVDVMGQNLLQTGRLVFVAQRLLLRATQGDRTASLATRHLLAIRDGRIELVDELCTGVMPD